MQKPSKPALEIELALVSPPEPGLHIVATPIGNLADISLRALVTLAHADLIYCEDTRQTRKLLERYSIRAGLRTYHDHNAAEMRPAILKQLGEGKIIALVSDAGTPLISDPGFKLVREAIAAGHNARSEPGASAVLAALTVSGLPTDRFLFLGFLPPKAAARRKEIATIKEVNASLVVFESPSRLAAALVDLAAILGNRRAAIARELTKLHEEVRRGTLSELAARAQQEPPPMGEIVLIIAPPEGAAPVQDIDAALSAALAKKSLKEAVAEVSAQSGLPRRVVYARALALSSEKRQ